MVEECGDDEPRREDEYGRGIVRGQGGDSKGVVVREDCQHDPCRARGQGQEALECVTCEQRVERVQMVGGTRLVSPSQVVEPADAQAEERDEALAVGLLQALSGIQAGLVCLKIKCLNKIRYFVKQVIMVKIWVVYVKG